MPFPFCSEFDKMCDFFTHEHFTALDEFKSLPLDDRRALVENNGRIIKSFKNSLCIHDTESCFCKGIDKATRSRYGQTITILWTNADSLSIGSILGWRRSTRS